MIFSLSQDWNITFVDYLYGISMFTPIFLNIISIVSACLSVKGTIRKTLVFLNSLMIIYYGIFCFIALYGFQEP